MKHLLHKITLMVAAVMLAISASAVKFEYKGVFYNLDLDSKTASVTYTGETPEGNTYSGEISIANKFKYEGEYYRVTSIGEKAFYGCDGIVYVKIGGLVTSIASQAFGNNSMKSLIIPSQVVTIAEDAFSGSSIDIFTPEALADYSFLKGVSTSAKVFAPEASLEGIRALWDGTAKSIEPHYYLEDLSTMSEARFRLHKTEYYSLPDAEPFEFSSVITHGVEIFPNEEGVYSWGNLSLGQLCEFQINYSLDYEDIGATEHIAAKPFIQCEEATVNAGVFTANIAAEENATYSPTEKGVYVDGTKYAADAAGKVTIDALAADAEYIAKPYAIYKGKTYYGAEFVISTKNATGIASAAADIKFTFNNLSKNGYIEVATTAAGDVAYFIMNITGQKEKEGTIDGDGKVNTVSTAELSSGIYLLNVSGAGITKTVKFVIK
ncbi:MAG: T9SS type A sorting domain-containing protein [Bacteroidales bacterium]|nr:T9SS type A sorting domain-containing protein [Bacteroidales bacterium]